MDKSVRISKALINTRIKANLLNLIILTISVVLLYFFVIYIIFGFGFGYNQRKQDIQSIEQKYDLRLGEGASYADYEKALKKFYFTSFQEDICLEYKKLYNKEYTIVHIYNIVVLNLPAEPTFDNYKTNFYQYSQKEDGTFDVDKEAIKVEGSGKYYERSMHDLYYNSYKKLKTLLENYDENYYAMKVKNYNFEVIARGISFALIFLVMFVAIPISNKEGATLIEKKFDLAYVNIRNGYLCKKWRIVLRNVLSFCIPFIGILLGNTYSIIILTVGYLFLDHLILLFSKNNLMLEEMICRVETCIISESLLFKNETEEAEYLSSEDGKRIDDPTFMKALEETNPMNIIKEIEE